MAEKSKRKHGFTIIELLVVISIIALLMGILLPILGRIRKSARSVACMAQLRQWALIFSAYAADHDGKPLACHEAWWHSKRPYYDSNDLLLCPEATKPGPRPFAQRTALDAWTTDPAFGHYIGSYGVNCWLADTQTLKEPGRQLRWQGNPYSEMNDAKHWYWTQRAMKPAVIPLIFDCVSPGAYPDDFDTPPSINGDFTLESWGGNGWSRKINHMRWECVGRHSREKMNMAFLDGSARQVGFKELWTIKWHSKFNTSNDWTVAGGVRPHDWPEWMRGFKD